MSLRWRGPGGHKSTKDETLEEHPLKPWSREGSTGTLTPIPESDDQSEAWSMGVGGLEHNRAPDDPSAYPHISLLLDIYPKVLERRFWQSDTWKRSMRNVDIFFFLYVLVNNVTLLAATNSKIPQGALLLHREISWLYIALAFLQTYCSFCYPPFYQRARPLLVYLNRAIRLLHLVLIITSLRTCITTGACIPALEGELNTVAAQPILSTIRFAYVLTGSFVAGLHSISLRLPFKGQVAFQAAYVTATLYYAIHPAAHILSHPLFTRPVATLCHSLDTLSFTLASASAGMYQDPTPMCTPALAPLLLVLFSHFFLCFLVPVLISYHLERSLKASYLHNDAQLVIVDPPTIATTLMRGGFVTLLFAAVCWQLALRFHAPLALWSAPCTWQGAHDGWLADLAAATANATAAASVVA